MGVLLGSSPQQQGGQAPPLNPNVLGDAQYHLNLGPLNLGQSNAGPSAPSKSTSLWDKINHVSDKIFSPTSHVVGGIAHQVAQPYNYVAKAAGYGMGYGDVLNKGLNDASRQTDYLTNAINQKFKSGQMSSQDHQKALDAITAQKTSIQQKIDQSHTDQKNYTNPRRIAASVGSIGLDLLTAGTGAAAEGAAKEGASLVPKLVKGAVAGGGSGLSSTLAQKKFTGKELAINTAAGVGLGTLPGLAGATVGKVKAGRVAKAAAESPTTAPIKDMKIGSDSMHGFDQSRVDEYAARARAGGNIEPIDVIHKDGKFLIQDGQHRYLGLKQAGADTAPIRVVNTDIESPSISALVKGESQAPMYTPKIEQTINNAQIVKPGVGTNVGGAGSEVKGLFSLGKEAQPAQRDLRAAIGDFGANKNQEAYQSKNLVNFFDKQKPTDNLQFIQKVQAGEKQATPELQKVADKLRSGFEQDYKLGQQLKPDLPYRNNYFAQSGVWADPKAAENFVNKWASPTLGGKPGALEQRSYPSIADGIAAGLKLKETNPATIALNSRTSLMKAKMAQDFMDSQAAKGVDPAITQKVLDRYLQPGFQSSATYKTAKQAAYALNNLQLGLSGFHFTSTGLNTVFSQFADGLKGIETGKVGKGVKNIVTSPLAPVIDSVSGKGLIAAAKAGATDGKYGKYVQLAKEANFPLGKSETYASRGLSQSLKDFQSKTISGAVKGTALAPFRAISSVAKPLMDHWVPSIKAGAFKNAVDVELARLGPNASKDAIRQAVQKVGDSIDNRFGQFTQDNLMWDKRLKDVSAILMRSPGWNIGTVREVGGGAANLLKPGTYKGLLKGEGLPNSTNYTLSLAAGTALIGSAINYMFTGENPKSAKDYFYPRTGQIDKNGNQERVSLPTYAKDIFSFTHNPGQTVGNKSNPLIALGRNVIQNKDYFGNEIRNPKDSVGTQLKQTGSFLGKNVLPFSITNSAQRVSKGPAAKAESFFGVNPAPAYITKSPFEQSVQTALNQTLGTKSLTPEEQSLINAKSQAKVQAQAGNKAGIDNLVNTGKITQKQGDNLKTSSQQSSLYNQFTYLMKLDKNTALDLYKKASPADKAKLQGISQGSLQKAIDDTNLRKQGINPKTGRVIQHKAK